MFVSSIFSSSFHSKGYVDLSSFVGRLNFHTVTLFHLHFLFHLGLALSSISAISALYMKFEKQWNQALSELNIHEPRQRRWTHLLIHTTLQTGVGVFLLLGGVPPATWICSALLGTLWMREELAKRYTAKTPLPASPVLKPCPSSQILPQEGESQNKEVEAIHANPINHNPPPHPLFSLTQGVPTELREQNFKDQDRALRSQMNVEDVFKRAKQIQQERKKGRMTKKTLSIESKKQAEWQKFNPLQYVGPFLTGIANAQGSRKHMEDRFFIGYIEKEIPIFSVFDGHGGKEIAEYLRMTSEEKMKVLFYHLPNLIQNPEFSEGMKRDDRIRAIIKNFFEYWNQDLLQNGKDLIPDIAKCSAGSTLISMMVYEGTLIFANTGDCRGIVSFGKNFQQMTRDAKPGDEAFAKKIVELGGFVKPPKDPQKDIYRVGGVLGVARAFGDFEVKGVTEIPKVTFFEMKQLNPQEGNYAVLASDGIWDVLSSEDAATLVQKLHAQKKSPDEMAKALVQLALKKEDSDNCTAIVVNLNTGKMRREEGLET